MQRLFLAGLMVGMSCLPGLANDTSFTFIGGVPKIQTEKQIAMQSEKLEFRYLPDPPAPKPVQGECPRGYYFDNGVCEGGEELWQADHSYTFVNHGPARTLTIGLPFDMPECDTEMGYHGPCLREGVSGLTTSIDGVAAKVSTHNLKMTEPYFINRIYTVQVPFKAGQTRVLRHRYHTLAIGSVEGKRFKYLLRTGST